MGLLGSVIGKSKVKAANKKLQLAKETDDTVKAEALLKEAIAIYAVIESGSSVFTLALYNWGAALLLSARLKKGGAEAVILYEEAGKKFSYCLVAKEDYLAAALDWGVVLMELTSFKEESERVDLYKLAKEKFELADSIQKGVASYNFACLHAVNGDFNDCKAALELARDYKNLPDEDDILNDVDMKIVKTQDWFEAFMTSVNEPEEAVTSENEEGTKKSNKTGAKGIYSNTVIREGTKVEYDKKE